MRITELLSSGDRKGVTYATKSLTLSIDEGSPDVKIIRSATSVGTSLKAPSIRLKQSNAARGVIIKEPTSEKGVPGTINLDEDDETLPKKKLKMPVGGRLSKRGHSVLNKDGYVQGNSSDLISELFSSSKADNSLDDDFLMITEHSSPDPSEKLEIVGPSLDKVIWKLPTNLEEQKVINLTGAAALVEKEKILAEKVKALIEKDAHVESYAQRVQQLEGMDRALGVGLAGASKRREEPLKKVIEHYSNHLLNSQEISLPFDRAFECMKDVGGHEMLEIICSKYLTEGHIEGCTAYDPEARDRYAAAMEELEGNPTFPYTQKILAATHLPNEEIYRSCMTAAHPSPLLPSLDFIIY